MQLNSNQDPFIASGNLCKSNRGFSIESRISFPFCGLLEITGEKREHRCNQSLGQKMRSQETVFFSFPRLRIQTEGSRLDRELSSLEHEGHRSCPLLSGDRHLYSVFLQKLSKKSLSTYMKELSFYHSIE